VSFRLLKLQLSHESENLPLCFCVRVTVHVQRRH